MCCLRLVKIKEGGECNAFPLITELLVMTVQTFAYWLSSPPHYDCINSITIISLDESEGPA